MDYTTTGITFEQCGFDYVVVDEAHLFKNLMLLTSLDDLAITGSQRATDLHMKIEHLRSRGGRVGLMATATPFANKIHRRVVQLATVPRPRPASTDRGIDSFEQFVATFGVEETGLEVDLVGNLKVKTRLAALVNVPELMGMVTATHRHQDRRRPEPAHPGTPATRGRATAAPDHRHPAQPTNTWT